MLVFNTFLVDMEEYEITVKYVSGNNKNTGVGIIAA